MQSFHFHSEIIYCFKVIYNLEQWHKKQILAADKPQEHLESISDFTVHTALLSQPTQMCTYHVWKVTISRGKVQKAPKGNHRNREKCEIKVQKQTNKQQT